MQVVAEREVADPEPAVVTTTPQTTTSSISSSQRTTTSDALNAELISRYAWRQSMLASLNVISLILAVRMILLVSVVGAVFLTYLALLEHDVLRLGALAIYCAVVVAPIVLLSYRRG